MLFQLEDYQMYISALGKKICIIFFCQYFPDFLNRDEQRVTYMVTLTLSEQFQKVDVLNLRKTVFQVPKLVLGGDPRNLSFWCNFTSA